MKFRYLATCTITIAFAALVANTGHAFEKVYDEKLGCEIMKPMSCEPEAKSERPRECAYSAEFYDAQREKIIHSLKQIVLHDLKIRIHKEVYAIADRLAENQPPSKVTQSWLTGMGKKLEQLGQFYQQRANQVLEVRINPASIVLPIDGTCLSEVKKSEKKAENILHGFADRMIQEMRQTKISL